MAVDGGWKTKAATDGFEGPLDPIERRGEQVPVSALSAPVSARSGEGEDGSQGRCPAGSGHQPGIARLGADADGPSQKRIIAEAIPAAIGFALTAP